VRLRAQQGPPFGGRARPFADALPVELGGSAALPDIHPRPDDADPGRQQYANRGPNAPETKSFRRAV